MLIGSSGVAFGGFMIMCLIGVGLVCIAGHFIMQFLIWLCENPIVLLAFTVGDIFILANLKAAGAFLGTTGILMAPFFGFTCLVWIFGSASKKGE